MRFHTIELILISSVTSPLSFLVSTFTTITTITTLTNTCEAFTTTNRNASSHFPVHSAFARSIPLRLHTKKPKAVPSRKIPTFLISNSFPSNPASAFVASSLLSRTTELYSSSSSSTNEEASPSTPTPPVILPADPRYSTQGPIGKGIFQIQREGEPTPEELSSENLLHILYLNTTDLEVNTLVWKGLGYRFDPITQSWNNEKVFPKWREKHPSPPDFIGMQRIYSKEIDQPSLKANQDLVKSIPAESKQNLKLFLKPLGFPGFKMADLTPNKTRRAQCVNWILFFREELYGYTIEELRKRRELKRAQEEQKPDDEWKPPFKAVF